MLQRALAEGSEVAKAAELSSALLQPPSNFLNYRYQPAITGLGAQAEARIFVEAVAMLLASGEQEDGRRTSPASTPACSRSTSGWMPCRGRRRRGPCPP